MFKKRKNSIYSDTDEVSRICATCKFAIPLVTVDDLMCPKYGIVKPDFICKKYDYNRLMKRPAKKRILNTNRFTQEDFSID